jgi:hypothetical protein
MSHEFKTGIGEIPIPDLTDTSFTFISKSGTTVSLDSINFGTDNSDTTCILTFRGNAQRNSPSRGVLKSRPTILKLDWTFYTGSDTTKGLYGVWGGGAGWTGQPLYVKWDKAERGELTGLLQRFRNDTIPLNEIIQVSLSGKVYFIEMESGYATRNPISIDNPVKGTPSIDGKNRNYLLVGQGIQNRGSFAWRVFDLRKKELLHTEYLPSTFALKTWGACDASPLIDGSTGIFIWPTESGVIYRGVLNDKKITGTDQFRYEFSDHPRQGIESSPSAFRHLGYFTDNAGNVFCLDLRTMAPRWSFFNTDDSDSSPVLDITNDSVSVYTGNEVDRQGQKGMAYIRKLDGLTGMLKWQFGMECYAITEPKADNGGILSTPLPGKLKADGIVWAIFSRTTRSGGGLFVCLNDTTGEPVFKVEIKHYSWVSPLAVYDSSGNPYVYFADVGGNIWLYDGLSGELIFNEKYDLTFESSPIAIGNRIIQPARGNRILSFLIK